jgi:hypothetical protein
MLRCEKVVILFACIGLLWACKQEVEKSETYSYQITANIKHCEGCSVKLLAGINREYKLQDSTIVKNGRFKFAGRVSEAGVYGVEVRHPKRFITVDVYLPADSIQLIMDADSALRTKFYERDNIGSSMMRIQTLLSSMVFRLGI